MGTRSRGRFGLAIGMALALLGACGSTNESEGSSSTIPTVTTVATNDAYPFDRTSASYFPGVSLDERLQMAQQVCDSIRENGDNYVLWLSLTNSRTDLVPFTTTPATLGSFSGLAVKSVCPQYVAQLRAALGTAANG